MSAPVAVTTGDSSAQKVEALAGLTLIAGFGLTIAFAVAVVAVANADLPIDVFEPPVVSALPHPLYDYEKNVFTEDGREQYMKEQWMKKEEKK